MIRGTTAELGNPVCMTIPFSTESARRVRQALESWLDRRGSASHVVDDVRLVATELVGNAVRHASPLDDGTVLVRWEAEDSTLLLSVRDGGSNSEPHVREASPYDDQGRGLAIVDALSSAWWVESSQRQRTVNVRLALA
jgi:serine/threonine-protein kinase RsbW